MHVWGLKGLKKGHTTQTFKKNNFLRGKFWSYQNNLCERMINGFLYYCGSNKKREIEKEPFLTLKNWKSDAFNVMNWYVYYN